MSSSAPASALTGGVVGAVAVLCGAVVYRVALASVAGVDVGGFFVDGLAALVLLVLGVLWPRTALVTGLLWGCCSALDVFFVLRFGGPLAANHLAWAGGASSALLGTEGALAIAAAVAVVAVAVAAVRAAPVVVALAAALVVVVGMVGPLFPGHAGSARSHPLVALWPSASTSTAPSSATLPFATPLPAPPSSWTSPPPWPRQRAPRHVVLFLSESTAARFVNSQTMPKLSALADQHGVRFVEHVAESPISIKAIFSTLCGLYPDPTATLETQSLPRIDCQSLPERVTAAGFDAALVHGGYFAFTDKTAFLAERGFQRLEDGETLRAACPSGSPYGWHNGWGIDDRCAVDAGLTWLDSRKDKTRGSLLVVIPLIPHHEYFVPDGVAAPFGTPTLKDRYQNALRFADDTFARVVDGYRARGLVDDTVFVFVGDHGEAFDEHPKNRLHGNFLYEENVRAPLIVIAPGFVPQGVTSSVPSSHADLAPTILDLLGLPPAPTMQGRALFRPHDTVRAQPLFTAVPTVKVGMRTPTRKAIIDLTSQTTEVFDLVRDPGETRALRGVDAEGAALAARARDFLVAQPKLLRALPKKEDATYLARAARGAGVAVAERKVMNMLRPCVPLTTSTSAPTVLAFSHLDPPPAFVGVGMDDDSRFRKAGSVTLTLSTDGAFAGGSADFSATINDEFLTSSVVQALPQHNDGVAIHAPATARPIKLCVWLSP